MARICKRATKAALASPNVVTLPTAAPRKVQQNYNRGAHEARRLLREAAPWPGEHLFPGQREAIRHAAVLSEVRYTPALLIAEAAFAFLPQEARESALTMLARGAVLNGSDSHRQAFAVAKATRMTFGEQHDLDFAMRRLRGEGL